VTPPYFEPGPEAPLNPGELTRICIENGYDSLLLQEDQLPLAVFDLSTGLLGEILHQLSKYSIPVALVIQDPGKYSDSFQAFLREANHGRSVRSFASREEAAVWLQAQQDNRDFTGEPDAG
jgi:hypothetical protein